MLKIHFPAFKEWKIIADQVINTLIIPASGPVEFTIKNTNLDVVVDFDADNGYLKPNFWDISMDLGDTFLVQTNWFNEFMMWQIFEFSYVMISNSVYFLGPYIFDNMAEPIVNKWLNDYHYRFTINDPIDGEEQQADYKIDWRHTEAPWIAS